MRALQCCLPGVIIEKGDEFREEGFEGGVFVPLVLIGLEKIAHVFGPDESVSDLAFQDKVHKPGVSN